LKNDADNVNLLQQTSLVHGLNITVLLIYRKKTVVTSMLWSTHISLFHIHFRAAMWSNTQQPTSATHQAAIKITRQTSALLQFFW